MRTFLIVSLLAAFSASSQGQGTVLFTTKSGTTVNAPVRYGGWDLPISINGALVRGSGEYAVLGQLYGAPIGGKLQPLGTPVPFRSDAGVGYITAGSIVAIPAAPEGGSAQVKMVAWLANLGSSYQEAISQGRGGIGESQTITVSGLGGGLTPPALPAGLQGFSVILVPEPSLGALVAVGALSLGLQRKFRRT